MVRLLELYLLVGRLVVVKKGPGEPDPDMLNDQAPADRRASCGSMMVPKMAVSP
jgi:hypothetical protein